MVLVAAGGPGQARVNADARATLGVANTCGVDETAPAVCGVQMSDAREQFQLSLRDELRDVLRVVVRDDAVGDPVPEVNGTRDRGVVQPSRDGHESPVLDQSVRAVPGRLGEGVADRFRSAGFPVERTVH